MEKPDIEILDTHLNGPHVGLYINGTLFCVVGENNVEKLGTIRSMIDALIEQEDIMQSLRNGYEVDNERLQGAWKQTYFALTKPGCTDE